MGSWTYKTTIFDGEKYEINGFNIWDYSWVNTHETITIKDSIYNHDYVFFIYRLKDTNVVFAAGEFSNCVWGIYEYDAV